MLGSDDNSWAFDGYNVSWFERNARLFGKFLSQQQVGVVKPGDL